MNDFKQLIEGAKEQYNKVIIVNDDDDSTKYKSYCKENQIPIYDLSVKLAELLEKIPKKIKHHEASDILKKWFKEQKDDVIAFDNIDYLFSQELGKNDLINYFNYKTRQNSDPIVILFIKAKKMNNLLIYSEEGKPDYIEIDISSNEGFVVGWKK